MEVHMKQRCVIEFLHVEKIAPRDNHRHFLNVYGDQTVDVSTVRRWVARFSSGNGDVKNKPCSGWPCTAVTPRNEEHLDQLIRANWQITTMELCTELNIGFSVLETMLATLECRKVCARLVPRMLTQEHKEHLMQACQDLLNQYKAEGNSFLDRIIIIGDKTCCHHYEPESKRQPMEWRHMNSPSKKKFKTLPSAGKVMCTVFWDRKGMILMDFLEPGQTINSDRYIAMLTELKARISRVRPEKKTAFLLQHNNARPHTSLKTVEHIVNLGWTVLPHPPYSLDLAPSDFHPFGPMKDGLHGQHFPSNNTVV